MEMSISEIKKMAENLIVAEEKRRKLADFLRQENGKLELIKKSEPANIDKMKIAGVDGGIVRKALHGFDFILARATSVCFEYLNGRISNVKYFPSKVTTPKFFTLEAVSDIDYAYFASIFRQKLEIETAKKAAENFKPDILLLDGSIVPHYATKPSSSSPAYDDYEKLMAGYQDLYKICEENNVLLAGVVEDSRNERFCNIIRDHVLPKIPNFPQDLIGILEKTRDTNLLFWVLQEKERTITFDYTPDVEKHQILKSFFNKEFYSFYLKTAKLDKPVRVDFMSKEKEDFLASVILAISGQNRNYGFPSVLIEADNVAKMSEQEAENFYSCILKYTGNMPSAMKLRREQRPF